MILYFIGLTWWVVWAVFQSRGVDYRFLAVGALVPLGMDIAVGHWAFGHTLAAAAVVMIVVMVAQRSRLGQRRWLGIPIGMLAHLLLDGVWGDQAVFWWPALGADWGNHPLVPGVTLLVVRELIGLLACVAFYKQFGLSDTVARRTFLTTGMVSRRPTPRQGNPPKR